LAKLLRHARFDILHAHMFWSSLFASPIARVCGLPAIVETLHGTEAWRTGWKANRMVDRATTLFVSRYVAVSQSDADFLQTRKRVAPENISLIHNGIDIRRFSIAPHVRGTIRQSLGIAEGDPVLVVVARFHPGKGHRVLLDAMRHLHPAYPNLKLICLGEGELEAELRDTCARFGLTDFVRFAGYQKNVPEWLAAADINVLPTFYEGFPLTVLEAMAAGLPTVASNVGGIPEAIEHGVSGLLVPPANPQSLADAIAALLDDARMRRQLGQAARTRLERDFLLTRQIKLTEQMYVELCGGVCRRKDRAFAVGLSEL
jgi:glycosyltransferase involved in cell wall biosynthesis